MSAQAQFAAVQVVSALAQGWLDRKLQGIQNKLARKQAENVNLVRRAQNELQAAESSYALWAQSVTNQRRLRVSGKQADAAQESLARLQDQRAGAGFARSVQAAEEQGAIAARSAFQGATGSSRDIIAGTAAVRAALVAEQAQRTGEQQEYEIQQRAGNVIGDAIQGLDNTAILSNLNMNVERAAQKPITGSFLYDLIGQSDNIAKMFGGKNTPDTKGVVPSSEKSGTVTASDLSFQSKQDYSVATAPNAPRGQGFYAPRNSDPFQI